MSERMNDDEKAAVQAIRDAFPADASLPAEKTWQLHGRLKPVAGRPVSRRVAGLVVGLSVAASLVVAAGAFAAYSLMRDDSADLPPVAVAPAPSERPGVEPTVERPDSVPGRALQAMNPSGKVLHFTSVSDTRFGPQMGQSTEEMWYDTKTHAGRLVRVEGGGAVVETIVSDGSRASLTTKRAGEASETIATELTGRVGKSFDKLATYRKMLESGTATVTATGMKDGIKTYKIRADVAAFGSGNIHMVMEAEIRAADYLPISLRSSMTDRKGKTLPLNTREFSRFQTVDIHELPVGWLTPFPADEKLERHGFKGTVDL